MNSGCWGLEAEKQASLCVVPQCESSLLLGTQKWILSEVNWLEERKWFSPIVLKAKGPLKRDKETDLKQIRERYKFNIENEFFVKTKAGGVSYTSVHCKCLAATLSSWLFFLLQYFLNPRCVQKFLHTPIYPCSFSVKLHRAPKVASHQAMLGSHRQPLIASKLLQKFPFYDVTLSIWEQSERSAGNPSRLRRDWLAHTLLLLEMSCWETSRALDHESTSTF